MPFAPIHNIEPHTIICKENRFTGRIPFQVHIQHQVGVCHQNCRFKDRFLVELGNGLLSFLKGPLVKGRFPCFGPFVHFEQGCVSFFLA
jgi:hypothetical protein